MAKTQSRSVPALKVTQWLDEWEQVTFDENVFQSRPKPHFYLFTLPASVLKALTGVYRRSATPGQPRAQDPNVQRGHDEARSLTIREFAKYGFPWCEMSAANRNAPDSHLLRKPGWLPTAIIVNILAHGDERGAGAIGKSDLVTVDDWGEGSRYNCQQVSRERTGNPTQSFPWKSSMASIAFGLSRTLMLEPTLSYQLSRSMPSIEAGRRTSFGP